MDPGNHGFITIPSQQKQQLWEAGMFDQLVQNGSVHLPCIQEFCCRRRESKLLYIIILPVRNIRFTKKEIC